ncbi:hypothetical protein HII36_10435 [Nonomuraea sp. NN258]|uniref:hypothetical protein n=1 Tax=Nonomuraea antri TaxID=2730852 RepID=UPI0015697444|nr:hypothetical protein [Nonomuraea antri]NRQ32250.1 hypothetical protein [Nonomuraea antri]
MSVRRFTRQHRIVLTAFNGAKILRQLLITRQFRVVGAATGVAIALAAAVRDTWTIGPVAPLAGWLAGVVLAEIVFPRADRVRFRRPLAVNLVPVPLTWLWRLSAIVSCAVALRAVVRSFHTEVPVAERMWAVATLVTLLIVMALLNGLRTRPLAAGPADLVDAELAMRSRSARALMGAGAVLALWIAPLSGLPTPPTVVTLLFAYVLPLVIWFAALQPVLTERPPWRAPFVLAPALALALALALSVWQPAPDVVTKAQSDAARLRSVVPADASLRLADLNPAARTWDVYLSAESPIPLPGARMHLPGEAGMGRPAPLAVSGDGRRLAYLDAATGRLVLTDPVGRWVRDLTGPLADADVPEPVLSHDGRYAALVSPSGAELIDTAAGVRTRLPGVVRVFGVGPDGVVGATGHLALTGAPDVELLTLDHRGAVRTRVPFDPTLHVRATPDGRSLAVVTGDEVMTMDARTGRIGGRVPLKAPRHYDVPRPLGWAADGRLLIEIEPDDDDRGVYHLVDLETGRSSRVEGLPDDLQQPVFGRIT